MKEELKEEELNQEQQDAQQTSPQTEPNEQNESEEEKNAETSEPAAEEKTIEEQLEAANNEIASLKDQLLRKIAEFDNYRKRTIKEKTDLILNGGEKTITTILPVIDDMERALKNMQQAEDVSAVVEGVELIYKKFMDILGKQGVSVIDTKEADSRTQRQGDGLHPDRIQTQRESHPPRSSGRRTLRRHIIIYI